MAALGARQRHWVWWTEMGLVISSFNDQGNRGIVELPTEACQDFPGDLRKLRLHALVRSLFRELDPTCYSRAFTCGN